MDANLITIRRSEVQRQIERLKVQIDALEVELGELDVAEKVFARLSGAKRDSASEENKRDAPVPAGANTSRPSVRQMILESLMDARQRGVRGLVPKDIREYIFLTYHVDLGQQINTNASRMWRELGELVKDEATGLFSLPLKEKPVDDTTVESPSTGLFETGAQGREAGPGGGT